MTRRHREALGLTGLGVAVASMALVESGAPLWLALIALAALTCAWGWLR